ncbi:hypothetical protein [Pseudooceanicola nanhaiensis]|uniref:hypothetical protein n=1 Tax=Pseudooceanicola nanhaiensis TaxID=375761 RepID=UPI0040599410
MMPFDAIISISGILVCLVGLVHVVIAYPKWKKFGPERAWMCFEMGFRFATEGEATVRDTLMQLQETIGEPTDGPKKKYGALYDRLAFDLLGEAYAPFRELLRDHAEVLEDRNWLEPGLLEALLSTAADDTSAR